MRKDLFAFPRLGALALAVAAVAPSAGWAATATSVDDVTIAGLDSDEFSGTLPTGDERDVTINIQDCQELIAGPEDKITITWSISSSATEPRYEVKYAAPGQACTITKFDTSPTTDTCEQGQDATTLGDTVTFQIRVDTLFGTTFTSPADCLDPQNDGRFDVILILEQEETTGGDTANPGAPDTVEFFMALERPAAPSGVTAIPGETDVRVKWDSVSDAAYYYVYVSPDLSDFDVDYPENISRNGNRADGTSETVDGLDALTTYYAVVVSVNDAGNRSVVSEATEFTTVPSEDFWEQYRAAGGVEEGGCTTSGGRGSVPLGLLVGLAALALARDRRRRGLAPVAFVLALVVPAAASASIVYDTEENISGAFELKLGTYTPAIDSDFDGRGPYEETFGGSTPLLLELEYDYQFWRGVGSLGVFGSIGWSQVRGDSVSVEGAATNDRTALRLMPLRAGLVYRFDYLQQRWNVPLVFSAKLGLDYFAWWVTADGKVADARDTDGHLSVGRGGTTGWNLGLGGYFLLDSLAPRMATTFASNTGVDNTYLFAEFVHTRADDFGSKSSWDLSDSTVLFGLAFEF